MSIDYGDSQERDVIDMKCLGCNQEPCTGQFPTCTNRPVTMTVHNNLNPHVLDSLTVYEDIFDKTILQDHCPICGERIELILRKMYGYTVGSFQKITFIKHLCEDSGLGLREAKNVIDALCIQIYTAIGINNIVAERKVELREKILLEIDKLKLRLEKLE